MIALICAHARDIMFLTGGAIVGGACVLAVVVRWPWLVFLEHKKD